MAYILNIETATRNCSVSIAKDGQTLICSEVAEQGYSHAEKLHVFIEGVLQESGLSFRDLSAVAVSQGPGSYTGLRIGVSAAKGLCFALQIPMIAVDTLQVLALQLKVESGLIVPMLDARRMEVYSAVFDANHQKIRSVEAEIITENSFADYKDTLYLVGDGAGKCEALLNDARFVYSADVVYPSAREMALLSHEKHKKNDTVDVAYFEPYYLKDFMITKKGS